MNRYAETCMHAVGAMYIGWQTCLASAGAAAAVLPVSGRSDPCRLSLTVKAGLGACAAAAGAAGTSASAAAVAKASTACRCSAHHPILCLRGHRGEGCQVYLLPNACSRHTWARLLLPDGCWRPLLMRQAGRQALGGPQHGRERAAKACHPMPNQACCASHTSDHAPHNPRGLQCSTHIRFDKPTPHLLKGVCEGV